MPVPYTIDAVAALRHAERIGTPAEEIQQHLGWDSHMLARVCRTHEIDLVVVSPAELPHPARAPISIDLQHIISRLTPRQAEIFRILQPRTYADVYQQWVSAAMMAKLIGVSGAHSITTSIGGLARRLDRMDAEYQIEGRKGNHGGYRLVIKEPVQ